MAQPRVMFEAAIRQGVGQRLRQFRGDFAAKIFDQPQSQRASLHQGARGQRGLALSDLAQRVVRMAKEYFPLWGQGHGASAMIQQVCAQTVFEPFHARWAYYFETFKDKAPQKPGGPDRKYLSKIIRFHSPTLIIVKTPTAPVP